jgi:hypothetical protein
MYSYTVSCVDYLYDNTYHPRIVVSASFDWHITLLLLLVVIEWC